MFCKFFTFYNTLIICSDFDLFSTGSTTLSLSDGVMFELYHHICCRLFDRIIHSLMVVSTIFKGNCALLINENLVFDEALSIELFIVLDFFFNFVKEVRINNSLISCSVGLLFQPVNFGYFLVVLMQNLFDVILHLFDLFLVAAAHELIFGALRCLKLAHLTFEDMSQLFQNHLLLFLVVYAQDAVV